MSIRRWVIAGLLAAAACGGGEEPAERPRFSGEEVDAARSSWPEGLAAMVDSGNAAYRAGRLDEAADVFQRATTRYPHIGAPWFGLYMAEHARGNLEEADSALAKAEYLTPGLAEMHRAASDSAAARGMVPPSGDSEAPVMPRGHPQIPQEDGQ